MPGFGATLAVSLNQRLDAGPVTTHQVKVLAKRTAADRHKVSVEHWEPGASQLRLDATCETFDPLAVGDTVTLKVHPGALGLAWVEKL